MKRVSWILTMALAVAVAGCSARNPTPKATAEQLEKSFQTADALTTNAVIQATACGSACGTGTPKAFSRFLAPGRSGPAWRRDGRDGATRLRTLRTPRGSADLANQAEAEPVRLLSGGLIASAGS